MLKSVVCGRLDPPSIDHICTESEENSGGRCPCSASISMAVLKGCKGISMPNNAKYMPFPMFGSTGY